MQRSIILAGLMALTAGPTLAGEVEDLMKQGQGSLNRFDYRGAISAYDQALEVDPDNAMTLNSRCWARALWNNELREAQRDCDRSLYLKPYNAATLNTRGFLDYRQGNFKASIDDYTKSIKLNWQNASSYYMRGQAYLKVGDTMHAKFDFMKANELDPAIKVKYSKYSIPWPPISL